MWREITITIVALINIIGAAQACDSNNDCGPSLDKICHENKCICSKDKPIEDQDRCLPQAIIGESCSVQDQCLADSMCIEGYCACGINDISVYNPSRKLNYCQPKRKLDQECNVDAQCPTSAYCSGARGCLCSNGYSAANVSSNGDLETTECLPKTCSVTSDCEEYHQCDENKCKCLATHFDISTAKCYKFGSTGGKPSDQLINNNQDGIGGGGSGGGDFTSILKDLTRNSDKMWLVLIILIVLTLMLLILILSLLRRHYLGYCWTAHKKEYEPNTTTTPGGGGGHFDKNSINNKSFRRRNGELDDDNSNHDDDQDDSTEDKSTLVDKRTTASGGVSHSSKKGDFVAISMNGKNKTTYNNKDKDRPLATAAANNAAAAAGYQPSPLKSSTSTPV